MSGRKYCYIQLNTLKTKNVFSGGTMNRKDRSNDFIKPSAEEYKKKRNKNSVNYQGKIDRQTNASKKDLNYKNITDINSNKELEKRKGDIHIKIEEPLDPAKERKENIKFVVVVAIFFVLTIIAKIAYTNMQNQEKISLSKTKWYVSDEADVEKVGHLELEFKNNGTFDMYKADTQVTCMNGKYSIMFKGIMKLKCEERGFNPPGKWDCKKTSTFKYNMKDNTLKLKYNGVEVKFYKQGNSDEEYISDVNKEVLHKKYFINKEAKMLVTFYRNNMYIYMLDKTKNIFGERGEVLGDICFSGEYAVDSKKKKMTVNVDEEYYEITSNPLWEGMTEYKEYKFSYKLESDKKLTLQYGNKAYEFEKYIIEE